MRLVMQSQPAILGYRTNNAQTKMHTAQAKLELEIQDSKLEMTSELPKIQIDQSQCFSESGLKSSRELTAENAANALQQMQASVGRIADQGNQMANIGTGANVIAEQAYFNAYDQFATDYNMVTMPKSRPKITVIEGRINFSANRAKVVGTPRLSKPEIDYTPGKVEYSMQQYQKLTIQMAESKFSVLG